MRKTIKRAFLAFSLSIAGAFPLFADQVTSTAFKGLNSNENSVVIDPSEAQDLLNVDVTVGAKSIKKRSGYGLYKAIGTGQAMRGGYHAFDLSGNDYQLWGSSTSLYGIVSDGTPAQLISSATLNSTWDCADTQGYSYCVDSNRDGYIKTDGATMTWYPAPLGTMVESTPDRVIVAGVASYPNTLYISQSNTFANFTTGVNETDAWTEVIAAPGSHLTHIRYGCGKLLWWKDSSFGTFDFDDQYTARINTVSGIIGTLDNTSAIDPGGNVWFRGQDGHTWKYDCSSLEKASLDISPNVQAAGKRVSNLWTQTTSSDFGTGDGFSTFADTTTSAGDVVISGISDEFTSTAAWSSSSGTWSISGSTASSPSVKYTISTLLNSTGSISNSFYMKARVFVDTDLFGQGKLCVGAVNSSHQGYFSCLDSGDYQSNYRVTITTSPGDSFNSAVSSGTESFLGDNQFHTITLTRSQSGAMTSTYDGIKPLALTKTNVTGLTNVMIYAQSSFSGNPSKIDYVYLRSSTGTYYSSVKNVPNLTAWNTLGVNQQLNNGTQTLYMRSSTNSFTTLSSTPSWTEQNAGGLITISTGTYFQVKDDFTITAATQTNTLNDFTVNWYEGTATDQAYMFYFDNAIWQSVAYGSGQSTNNYIFKYDLINQGWTLYNIGTGGLLSQGNTLYFGDPSAGNVFNYGSSTSDNGTAINAYWRSKSFSNSDPFLQSQLTNIDVFAKKDQGTTLTTTYTTDTSAATAYSISLSSSSLHVQNRKLLPSGKLGYTFDLKLGDTSASSAWEILGYRIGFIPQPYRPTQ